MLNSDIQKKTIHCLLADYPQLVAIYIFGSMAQGNQHGLSDLDVAVLSDGRPLDTWQLWLTGQKLAALVHMEVDVVDLLKASAVMRMQVVSNGQCIFAGEQQLRERFEDYVFGAYVRLNESRRAIIQDIYQRNSVYG